MNQPLPLNPKTMTKRILIDNEITCSLDEFIKVNTAPDVGPLTKEEIKLLQNLRIGEEIYIGFSLIKAVG